MKQVRIDNLEKLVPAELDVVTTDPTFQEQTRLLLEGKITVPEWLDSVADVLNDRIDIPYLPEALEDRVFRTGLRFAGNILHGLLSDGSASSSKPTAIPRG